MSAAERRGYRVGDREGDAVGAGGGLGIAGDDGDRGHGATFEAVPAWALMPRLAYSSIRTMSRPSPLVGRNQWNRRAIDRYLLSR
jgi:hypothetical protein